MSRILKIEICLDNDSFQEESGTELTSVFREIQRKFQWIQLPKVGVQTIRDTNGNTVGSFTLETREVE
jgi:hypothetical protein